MSSRYSIYYARKENQDPFVCLQYIPGSPDFEENNCEKYAQAHRDLIYLAEQENVGFFHYEHWKDGKLWRRLMYNSDYYWLKADGEPEPWEIILFFSEDQLHLTLRSYEPERHAEIRSIWQRKHIQEGDNFPVLEFFNVIEGLKTYWNLVTI